MNRKSLMDFFFSSRGQWILLTGFAMIVFLVNLNSEGLFAAQEGKAGVVTRNMIESGNWLSMEFKGTHTDEKPMFCYWLYAVSASVFGMNEFALRFPSAVSAILTVLMTAWLGMKIYGRRTGFLSAYILCTMITFVNLGRVARIDIILTVFFMFAMLCLYRGYWEKNKATWWLYLFYITIGLSVLIKGPVGAVLAAFMIFLYGCIFRKWKMWWELKPISGIIIVLLISAPWYIYEGLRTGGDFTWTFLVEHNIKRFVGGSEFKGGKHQPQYFYFGKFFVGALPWSAAIPFLLFQFRRKVKNLRPESWFMGIWFLSIFIFFTLGAVKRGDYILPLYPAAAIIIGRYLIILENLKFKLYHKWIYGWLTVVGLVLVTLGVILSGALYTIGRKAVYEGLPHMNARDGHGMMTVSNIVNNNLIAFIIAAIIILALLYMIGKILAEGKFIKALSWYLPAQLLVMVIYFQFIMVAVDQVSTNKHFCIRAAEIIPENEKVVYVWFLDPEIVYYLRRDYEAPAAKDTDAYVKQFNYLIMQGKDYRRMDKEKAPFNEFEVAATTIKGHASPSVLMVRKGILNPETGK